MTRREQVERAVIGCVLARPDLADELKSEWFDDLQFGHFLTTIQKMRKDGHPVDLTTVVQKEGFDSMPLLLESQEQCDSPENFPFWRNHLVNASDRKRMLQAAQKFIAHLPGSNGSLPKLITELEASLCPTLPGLSSLTDSHQSSAGLLSSLEEKFNNQGKLSGLDTGFMDLNRMTDGLQLGELTVLAARPSMGKTAIACNLVNKICLENKVPTLFLSLEMSGSALCRRLLSSNQKVEMGALKSGRLTESDFAKTSNFNKILKNSPLFIQESFKGMTGSEAAAIIRKSVRQHGVKFVVLDYLQKLRSDTKQEKRTYEVAEASGCLVEAARGQGVAFLCLAQLNRESEKDKGRLPRPNDLADSGQIERDADTVLLLHRDRNNPEQTKLIIGKQRDGETGVVDLRFEGRFCQFQNLGFEHPEYSTTKDP